MNYRMIFLMAMIPTLMHARQGAAQQRLPARFEVTATSIHSPKIGWTVDRSFRAAKQNVAWQDEPSSIVEPQLSANDDGVAEGAIIGGAAGVLLGAAWGHEWANYGPDEKTKITIVGSAMGAAVGACLGMVIDSLL